MSDIQHKFITNAKKQENMIHNEENLLNRRRYKSVVFYILAMNNKMLILRKYHLKYKTLRNKYDKNICVF